MVKATDWLQAKANQIYGFIPYKKPPKEAFDRSKLVAHRGCWNRSDRLENTMAAFDHCLNKKIWAIEFDVRFTSDNVPVVHHDATLARVFNDPRKLEEVDFLTLRKEFPQIPTLIEVVSRYQNKLHLMIELKTTPTEEQVENLRKDLIVLKPIEEYHFMSLNFQHFKPLSFCPKKAFVSIGRTNIKSIFHESLVEGIGAVTGQYLLVSNKMKVSCQDLDMKVGTGFPDSKNLLYREVNRGVDWIFTNEADKLSQFL